jgi:hypothetical protein
MHGGVLWHYGGTAFHACNNAVLLRMDEMPGKNVGLGGRGYVHCAIDLPGYRLWDRGTVLSRRASNVSAVWVRLYRLHVYAAFRLYLCLCLHCV